jgi:hypothetical protein
VARAALAATVTEAGTVTEVLLLESFTASPLLGAAPFSVTVQESTPDPAIDELAQVSALSASVGCLRFLS